MRTGLLAVALVVPFLVAADAPEGDAARAEIKKLEGTWVVESVTQDGKPVLSEQENQFIFSGDKLTLMQSKKPTGFVETKMTYKVDLAQKPTAIDFAPEQSKPGTLAMRGIYQLQGDNLKLCLSLRPSRRPQEMSDKEQVLFILKRKK